jgi:hypothetical protein
MKLTDKEKDLIVRALETHVEDNETLLIDMGDNEFIRNRAHARIMELEELIKKVEK